ncbi:MAG: rod shape-determining protein RodA [Thermodesulfobacteriota bacterium]|nr:rod shape-determining protein RodA [Thermodesulfobacteriota bacterium]
MKIDRRLLTHFDWILLGLVLAISGIGILNLYSSGYNLCAGGELLYVKQMSWVLLGLIMMVIAFSVDYHIIIRHAYLIYAVSILLLLLVFFYGNMTHGSQRWLTIWGFSFQPSELMKLVIVIVLARYFNDNAESGHHFGNLAVLLALLGMPFLLIVKQPDLGTAMFLVILVFCMAVFVGVGRKFLVCFISGGMVLAPLFWFLIKDYQRERILTFLSPERDPLGAGYHIIQSIIAIGSGGIWGKGFLKGTQTQLRFLPEQQTDFAFSVFAEEWGFLGVSVLMLIFFALIMWGLKIARHSRDFPGALMAFGVTMFVFWGILINIGMVIGILPVVGIPLPFFSYGGSSMIVLMTGAGLLINVSMRRFILQP